MFSVRPKMPIRYDLAVAAGNVSEGGSVPLRVKGGGLDNEFPGV